MKVSMAVSEGGVGGASGTSGPAAVSAKLVGKGSNLRINPDSANNSKTLERSSREAEYSRWVRKRKNPRQVALAGVGVIDKRAA
jgi:hypothetical protein